MFSNQTATVPSCTLHDPLAAPNVLCLTCDKLFGSEEPASKVLHAFEGLTGRSHIRLSWQWKSSER